MNLSRCFACMSPVSGPRCPRCGRDNLVMDYVEGETLGARLVRTRQTLKPEAAVRLLLPVIRDLETVHARGIIHRDISPDNLMLRPDGSLVLLDLGAARDIKAEACSTSLETVDVSSFDTSSVTDMSFMFFGCDNLRELNVEHFDTSHVTGWELFMPDAVDPGWRRHFTA